MAGNEKLRSVFSSMIENFHRANHAHNENVLNKNISAFDKLKLDIAYEATDEKLKRTFKKRITY